MSTSILIIEDDDFQITLLKYLLNKAFSNIEIEVAVNSCEALTHLKQKHFSLIILDLGLPDSDGIDIIENINSTTASPIIVLSGNDTEEVLKAVRLHGVTEFVGKNVNAKILITLIRSLIIDIT
jgi:DNA-binding response OmpR family regulator